LDLRRIRSIPCKAKTQQFVYPRESARIKRIWEIPEKGKPSERTGRKAMGPKAFCYGSPAASISMILNFERRTK